MSIGDVNSNARGSGARYNDGKPPMELIPLSLIADSIRASGEHGEHYVACLEALGHWQGGGTVADLWRAARCLSLACCDATLDEAWVECAEVFNYGRKKYAAWNWAKGMPWSAPLGCAVRHLYAMMGGELSDGESGHAHRGHFLCNVVMLATFARTYPEGDDRPKGLFDIVTSEKRLYEETSAIAAVQDAAQGIDWSACFPTRAQLDAAATGKPPLEPSRIGTPAELAYLASFSPNNSTGCDLTDIRSHDVASVVHNAHPMHAEALRVADERSPEDRL